ncbi:hypothetical protein BGX21_008067 [Mortierella sp. AD011]|nr:hypothetical protein BGX20_007088 [Mortierella sp. AD010]KAF9398199.1 hypothetical protein BGX21_008067 [Mortierella sp. AD011]
MCLTLHEDEKNSKIFRALDEIIKNYVLYGSFTRMPGIASRSAALFIRDMIIYRELAESIKVSDAGRIEEILKWITIFFQDAGASNYANDLLHLHCWIHYGGPKEAKDALLSSLLINDYGEPRKRMPADLFQEHNNHLTKKLWSENESNARLGLLGRVSPSLRAFLHISSQFQKQFKIAKNKSCYKSVDSEGDVGRIKEWLRDIKIFGEESLDDTEIESKADFIDSGIKYLVRGKRIRTFREKGPASRQPGGGSMTVGLSNVDLDNEAEGEGEDQVDNDMGDSLDSDPNVNTDVDFGFDFDYDQHFDDDIDRMSEASVESV